MFKRFREKLIQHSMLMAIYSDQTKKNNFIELDLKNLLDDLKHMLEVSTWGKKWHQTILKWRAQCQWPQGLGVSFKLITSENLYFFFSFLFILFCLCLLFPPYPWPLQTKHIPSMFPYFYLFYLFPFIYHFLVSPMAPGLIGLLVPAP